MTASDIEMAEKGLNSVSMISVLMFSRVFEQFLIITILMIVGTLLCYLFNFINWFLLAPLHYCYYLRLLSVNEFIILNVVISLNVIIINIGCMFIGISDLHLKVFRWIKLRSWFELTSSSSIHSDSNWKRFISWLQIDILPFNSNGHYLLKL